jgi:hypothetical protein
LYWSDVIDGLSIIAEQISRRFSVNGAPHDPAFSDRATAVKGQAQILGKFIVFAIRTPAPELVILPTTRSITDDVRRPLENGEAR